MSKLGQPIIFKSTMIYYIDKQNQKNRLVALVADYSYGKRPRLETKNICEERICGNQWQQILKKTWDKIEKDLEQSLNKVSRKSGAQLRNTLKRRNEVWIQEEVRI